MSAGRTIFLTVAAALLLCRAALSGPVDDVRAGTNVTFQQMTATLTIKTKPFLIWWTIFETNSTTGAVAIPKEAGTLDFDVTVLFTNMPFPAVVMTGTEMPGDKIQWNANTNINELFHFDLGTTNIDFYVRNISARLTSTAADMPLVLDPLSGDIQNVRLDRYGGNGDNYVTITGNKDSASGLNVKIEVDDMDYYAHAGWAEMPEPEIMTCSVSGTNLTIDVTQAVQNVSYNVLYCTNLVSADWTVAAHFTNTADLLDWSFSLPEDGSCAYFRLVTE